MSDLQLVLLYLGTGCEAIIADLRGGAVDILIDGLASLGLVSLSRDS